MSDRIKGVIVGVSNAFVILVVFGIVVGASGGAPMVGSRRDPVIVQLMPYLGILFGAFAGAMLGAISASTAGLKHRTVVYVVLSLLMVAVIAPIWPAMMRYAIPSTIVHAVVLAHWTAPPPPAELPKAVVWKKS